MIQSGGSCGDPHGQNLRGGCPPSDARQPLCSHGTGGEERHPRLAADGAWLQEPARHHHGAHRPRGRAHGAHRRSEQRHPPHARDLGAHQRDRGCVLPLQQADRRMGDPRRSARERHRGGQNPGDQIRDEDRGRPEGAGRLRAHRPRPPNRRAGSRVRSPGLPRSAACRTSRTSRARCSASCA